MNPTGISRQDFLASPLLLAAGAGPGASPARAAVTGAVSDAVPFDFDRAAFAGILDRPFAHRQLAAPATFELATVAMSHFRNSLEAYADPNGFAAGPKSLHCAAVLYAGRSLLMVFDDRAYAKYSLGLLADEEMRPNDTSNRAYWTQLQKNPMAEFLMPLIAQGVSFFVCNNALTSLSIEIARRQATNGPLTREAVVAIHNELAGRLLPNTMLVPAGVAAVNAAQESRFTFLP
ncbi:MAG: hypothetical protein IAI50_15900 [Candidatus Eremiobacteraeota bacterium]|nr:hypothetical protein [Candidatus Eremiobacteraeota bacterium]